MYTFVYVLYISVVNILSIYNIKSIYKYNFHNNYIMQELYSDMEIEAQRNQIANSSHLLVSDRLEFTPTSNSNAPSEVDFSSFLLNTKLSTYEALIEGWNID